MRGVFITGTDTGAGKTVITGLLARYLLGKGYGVITQKWIQTGAETFPPDIKSHLRLMKRRRSHIENYLPHVSPYSFRFASSPHLAANLEGRKIKIEKIKRSYKFLSKRFDFIIVEGIGGVLVPFNEKKLVIDAAKELRLPVLIVADNKLGAINHSILTVEAIKNRNMKILGIIFNSRTPKANRIILKDNPRIIKKLTGVTVLGSLPNLKDKDSLYRAFMPIARRAYSRLKGKR